MKDLAPAILELAQLAKSYGIGFTIDAEEADRLELSLDLIEATFSDASLAGWEGYGLAVQAYQKRTPYVIDFLADLARRVGRRMPVRLVKGAYWDAEIKRAQIDGHPGYPVFTRKPNTDVSYLANARRMFDHGDALYPMFATHNAQTIAAIHALSLLPPGEGARRADEGAGHPGASARAVPSPQPLSPAGTSFGRRGERGFEFQKLHGMGDDLYAEVVPKHRLDTPCRVYAPVGSHEDLLPYLVRRLLENGANSSFVNRITDENVAIEDLVRDPVQTVSEFESIPHPRIPLPVDLFRSQPAPIASSDRNNSMGANLANDNDLRALAERINASVKPWRAAPLVPGAVVSGNALPVTNPADRRQTVGEWQPADSAAVEKALANAVAAQPAWDRTPAARASSSPSTWRASTTTSSPTPSSATRRAPSRARTGPGRAWWRTPRPAPSSWTRSATCPTPPR